MKIPLIIYYLQETRNVFRMSGIHFMNAWSETARGMPLQIPPFINRMLLKAKSSLTPRFSTSSTKIHEYFLNVR